MLIKIMTEENKDFFNIMGKYFSRKSFIKELDSQLYSNENMEWYLIYENNQLIGFISIEDRKKYYYIDNFYIFEQYRQMGYGELLFKRLFENYMLDNINNDEYKKIKLITKNIYAKVIFEKYGFTETGKNGKYIKMEIKI